MAPDNFRKFAHKIKATGNPVAFILTFCTIVVYFVSLIKPGLRIKEIVATWYLANNLDISAVVIKSL
jgi:hypothetical protein